MAGKFCKARLDGLSPLFHLHESSMLILCILSLVFAVVAAFGNLLVIRALWKASSIPVNLKKLFFSLALSDLAVGIFCATYVWCYRGDNVERGIDRKLQLCFILSQHFNCMLLFHVSSRLCVVFAYYCHCTG